MEQNESCKPFYADLTELWNLYIIFFQKRYSPRLKEIVPQTWFSYDHIQAIEAIHFKNTQETTDQERFWPYSIISSGCRLHEQEWIARYHGYCASVAAKGKHLVYISASFFDFSNTLPWSAHNHRKKYIVDIEKTPRIRSPYGRKTVWWKVTLPSRPKPEWNDVQGMKNSVFNTGSLRGYHSVRPAQLGVLFVKLANERCT